jgi:hypothetical protein
MEENLRATADLRKLESMLPAFQRPLTGEDGTFQQDESGVIRNVVEPSMTGGDVRAMELDRAKRFGDPRMVQEQREGGAQMEAMRSIEQYQKLNAALDKLIQSNPTQAETINAQRAAAEKHLLFKLQALTGKSYAGFANDAMLTAE